MVTEVGLLLRAHIGSCDSLFLLQSYYAAVHSAVRVLQVQIVLFDHSLVSDFNNLLSLQYNAICIEDTIVT
jgi:hypothetical protein